MIASDVFSASNCGAGYEFNGTTCVPCGRGYVKDNVFIYPTGNCVLCTNGFITASTGSTSQDNCTLGKTSHSKDSVMLGAKTLSLPPSKLLDHKQFSLRITNLFGFTGNCTVGQEQNDENNRPDECVPCAKGTYAPDVWMEDCIPCQQFHTTLQNGSSSMDQCVRKFLYTFSCVICVSRQSGYIYRMLKVKSVKTLTLNNIDCCKSFIEAKKS